ncbi:unnamed protein product [Arctogadus glacialis]
MLAVMMDELADHFHRSDSRETFHSCSAPCVTAELKCIEGYPRNFSDELPTPSGSSRKPLRRLEETFLRPSKLSYVSLLKHNPLADRPTGRQGDVELHPDAACMARRDQGPQPPDLPLPRGPTGGMTVFPPFLGTPERSETEGETQPPQHCLPARLLGQTPEQEMSESSSTEEEEEEEEEEDNRLRPVLSIQPVGGYSSQPPPSPRNPHHPHHPHHHHHHQQQP